VKCVIFQRLSESSHTGCQTCDQISLYKPESTLVVYEPYQVEISGVASYVINWQPTGFRKCADHTLCHNPTVLDI